MIRAVLLSMVVLGSGLAHADRADEAYGDAKSAYTALKGDQKRRSLRHHWLNVAKKFDGVAAKYPKSDRAPEALFNSGELYNELSRFSAKDEDRESARRSYRKLIESWPKHKLSDDAAYSLARILADRENDSAGARRVLESAAKNAGDKKKDIAALLAALPSTRPAKKTVRDEKSSSGSDDANDDEVIARNAKRSDDADLLMRDADDAVSPRDAKKTDDSALERDVKNDSEDAALSKRDAKLDSEDSVLSKRDGKKNSRDADDAAISKRDGKKSSDDSAKRDAKDDDSAISRRDGKKSSDDSAKRDVKDDFAISKRDGKDSRDAKDDDSAISKREGKKNSDDLGKRDGKDSRDAQDDSAISKRDGNKDSRDAKDDDSAISKRDGKKNSDDSGKRDGKDSRDAKDDSAISKRDGKKDSRDAKDDDAVVSKRDGKKNSDDSAKRDGKKDSRDTKDDDAVVSKRDGKKNSDDSAKRDAKDDSAISKRDGKKDSRDAKDDSAISKRDAKKKKSDDDDDAGRSALARAIDAVSRSSPAPSPTPVAIVARPSLTPVAARPAPAPIALRPATKLRDEDGASVSDVAEAIRRAIQPLGGGTRRDGEGPLTAQARRSAPTRPVDERDENVDDVEEGESPVVASLAERLRDVRVGARKPEDTADARSRFAKLAKNDGMSELTLAQQLGLKVRRVIIDAGHGGHDTGAIGPKGTKEKDVALAIARKLAAQLEAAGLEVILTRDDDTFVRLEDRTRFANKQKGDLFISIHCNAAPSKTLRGIETYTLNTSSNRYSIRLAARENATTERGVGDLQYILADLATKANTGESTRLAERVQKSLVRDLSGTWKGVKDLGNKEALFFVLLGARMPAILVETSFLSNPEEEERLTDDAYQQKIADSIAESVGGFLEERNKLAQVD